MTESSDLSTKKNSAYLIGIGGVGMSALAGLLCEKGYSVSGSDQAVYPPTSDTLAHLNIPVLTPYGPENVPIDADLLVIGNAVSRRHPEVEAILDSGVRYRSLPEVLREEFLWDRTSLVVAGTHGKTTTSSMLAWILHYSGYDPSFFIGGVTRNFEVPYRLGKGAEFVVEGDEYDSAFFDKRAKFLHYCPNGVILGNVEFDHSDIYRDIQDVELAFQRLLLLIPNNGILVAYGDSDRVRELVASAFCPVVTFGCGKGNNWQAVDVVPSDRGMCFRVVVDGVSQGEFVLGQWGKYNVINALGAMALSHHLGVSFEAMRDALLDFKGVARRLEELGTVGEVTIVDDFAHHPTAIKESIIAVRGKYPGCRVLAVFEPRSNTTVRKFLQTEITDALVEADGVFIGPIHRADRIPSEERLDITWILDKLENSGITAKHHNQFSDLLSDIRAEIHAGDVVLFMSNGSFGGIARRLLADLSA